VVSQDNDRGADRVVCFITAVPRSGPDRAPLAPTPGIGRKVASVVRFDTLATRDRSVIAGTPGDASADGLATQRARRFGVFGFGQP
jgi:mRNA interferase MazF